MTSSDLKKKLVAKTEYGTRLPNIAKSIDSLNINVDAIKDSVVNGENTNTIAVIPTDNLTRRYPFTFEPRRTLYCPVSSNIISEMRITVTDSLGRTIHYQKLGTRWRLRVRTKAIMAANSYKKMYGDKEPCSNISIMSLRVFGARLETC